MLAEFRSCTHTEDLYEEMDSFQVCELVVIRVHTDAEEQSGVTAIHDLVVPELHSGALCPSDW